MSHTVHPYSHRLGIIRDWKSRWFGAHGKYQEFLKGDVLLREFLVKKLRGFYVAGIEMERGKNSFKILIKTSRPGMIIGRNGEGAVKLKKDVLKQAHRIGVSVEGLDIEIDEVRSPETNAAIVSQMVAEGLEKRMPFKRVMKQAAEKTMSNRDVQGIRIALAGRLGGAEMARKEGVKKGRIPLQTLRADIDFAKERAHLGYGHIGIKVWIYKGDIFEDKK